MQTTLKRRAAILAQLHQSGAVQNRDLAHDLVVDVKTIRHDVQALARDGRLTRVRGGAVVPESARGPGAGSPKGGLGDRGAEDAAIALHAAQLVAPGSTLGLGTGPITTRIARALSRIPGLTVVTTSPATALAFDEHQARNQQIVLIGGVATATGECVGSIALATIGQLALDQLILEVGAVDPVRGLLSPTHLHAETDRALMDVTRRLVVVANHGAWGTTALATLAPMTAAAVLVTSTALDPAAQDRARAEAGELHLVDVPYRG